MANIGYIKFTGATQGEISKDATTSASIGNSWREGHESESLVYAFDMNAIVPRDPNSGAVIGTRRHQPSSFLKPLDKSSPLLWQALSTGETLEVEMKFWRTSLAGAQEHYFTIHYTDAVLVDGKIILPDINDDTNNSRGDQEKFSFTYRKVEWTHEKAGTSASDDWRKPVSA